MPLAASASPRRRSLLALALIATLTTSRRLRAATQFDLRVVVGQSGQQQADALAALRARFGPMLSDEDPQKLLRGSPPTAYLALGAVALQAAMSVRLNAPLVALFASRQAFERALSQGLPGIPATAIYAEPAPDQQMRLIASLYRRRVTVGVLISSPLSYLEPVLRQAATDNGLQLDAIRIEESAGLTRSLNILSAATVLLIHPDSALYTQASLRELLESTYRRRQPVIGFSAALVTAGTLASAYTSIDDTIVQLGPMLELITAGRLPAPRYPAFWRVSINDSVARSLDVAIDDDTRRLGVRP